MGTSSESKSDVATQDTPLLRKEESQLAATEYDVANYFTYYLCKFKLRAEWVNYQGVPQADLLGRLNAFALRNGLPEISSGGRAQVVASLESDSDENVEANPLSAISAAPSVVTEDKFPSEPTSFGLQDPAIALQVGLSSKHGTTWPFTFGAYAYAGVDVIPYPYLPDDLIEKCLEAIKVNDVEGLLDQLQSLTGQRGSSFHFSAIASQLFINSASIDQQRLSYSLLVWLCHSIASHLSGKSELSRRASGTAKLKTFAQNLVEGAKRRYRAKLGLVVEVKGEGELTYRGSTYNESCWPRWSRSFWATNRLELTVTLASFVVGALVNVVFNESPTLDKDDGAWAIPIFGVMIPGLMLLRFLGKRIIWACRRNNTSPDPMLGLRCCARFSWCNSGQMHSRPSSDKRFVCCRPARRGSCCGR